MERPSFFAYQADLAGQPFFFQRNRREPLAQGDHRFRYQGDPQSRLGPLEAASGIIGQAAEIQGKVLLPAAFLDDPFPTPIAQKGQILEGFQGKGIRQGRGKQVPDPHSAEIFLAKDLPVHSGQRKRCPDHGQVDGLFFQGIQQLVRIPFVQLERNLWIFLEKIPDSSEKPFPGSGRDHP